jgi:hypothetical protein
MIKHPSIMYGLQNFNDESELFMGAPQMHGNNKEHFQHLYD